MNIDHLLDKYAHHLIIHDQSYSQILSLLRKSDSISFNRVAAGNMNPTHLQYVMEDCTQYAIDKGIDSNSLNILVYKVERNLQSQKYYDEIYDEGDLYVTIEERAGYLNCESPSLFDKIDLAKGVSRYDVANKTQRLEDYLSRIVVCETDD